MWSLLYTGVINWLSVICDLLAFVIPFIIYKINQRLHAYGDPAWKKIENDE